MGFLKNLLILAKSILFTMKDFWCSYNNVQNFKDIDPNFKPKSIFNRCIIDDNI